MANVIKLGERPKTFKSIEVAVTLPDGTEGVIPVTYRYRTKREFGKWQDEAAAASTVKRNENEEFSWEKFYEQNTDAAADQLLKAIDTWGLDVPLSRDTLIQMGDEMPGAVVALLGAYAAACCQGRLGN